MVRYSLRQSTVQLCRLLSLFVRHSSLINAHSFLGGTYSIKLLEQYSVLVLF